MGAISYEAKFSPKNKTAMMSENTGVIERIGMTRLISPRLNELMNSMLDTVFDTVIMHLKAKTLLRVKAIPAKVHPKNIERADVKNQPEC